MSPSGDALFLIEDFGKATAGTRYGLSRQLVAREKGLLLDFKRWLGLARLLEGADNKERDVIAGKMREIGVNSKQVGRRLRNDSGFFKQFTFAGFEYAFAELHAAAGEVPATTIAVADQEHLVVGVDDAHLGAEGEPTRQAPLALQNFSDDAVAPRRADWRGIVDGEVGQGAVPSCGVVVGCGR